ncbi:ATP-binding protein [Chitiniphilus purpureus]|uniref:histidine kinase n=2 Tax=Chitiniphilus purpureus TaxID=2981137 RepID=A0ABY6DRA2_9NEIS|nr:ATP-binding protein [Chitiniphilus sp. CD1]UXY16905.1 ATP-binding protein [Chitiniphilus sp. CD1]
MFRLFIHVYLLQVVGVALALVGLNYAVTTFFKPYEHQYNWQMARGSFGHLARELRGLDPERQRARIAAWQPDYGLKLDLVHARQIALQQDELGFLERGMFFFRENDDYEQFYVPIEWPRSQWLLAIRTPPLPEVVLPVQIVSYMALAAVFALLLFVWVRPHWRELQSLRLAAQRFGEGDLSARTTVSRRSSVRELALQFNVMASRIESLIASRRDLTNAVSHELRTPMARLSFELDKARTLDHPAQWRTLADQMRQDLTELEALVSELLSFARLEQTSSHYVMEEVDTEDWLQSVIGMVTLEAEARGVVCVLHPDHPAWVELQPRQMARALINVVRNAIHHAQGRVEVRLVGYGDGFELRIDDDGPGIAPAERERVFDPFVRLDESRSRATGGFGLGLAIVRQIVKSHQGQVWIEDSPLGGARFLIRW